MKTTSFFPRNCFGLYETKHLIQKKKICRWVQIETILMHNRFSVFKNILFTEASQTNIRHFHSSFFIYRKYPWFSQRKESFEDVNFAMRILFLTVIDREFWVKIVSYCKTVTFGRYVIVISIHLPDSVWPKVFLSESCIVKFLYIKINDKPLHEYPPVALPYFTKQSCWLFYVLYVIRKCIEDHIS